MFGGGGAPTGRLAAWERRRRKGDGGGGTAELELHRSVTGADTDGPTAVATVRFCTMRAASQPL